MNQPILFFVSDFYPGGAQRQMFEIDKELKRRKIPIVILSFQDLNCSPSFKDHFYPLHKQLGTEIFFYKELKYRQPKNFLQKILLKLGLKKNTFNLNQYLEQFSEVIFVGEYTFQSIYKSLELNSRDHFNILIVNSRFQGEKYRAFNKSLKYNFIDGFDDRTQCNFEYEGFENYETYCLPLSFEPTNKYFVWKFKESTKKKIGIFTRLSKAKPLDPFFYCLSILHESNPNIELHIFGAGDPSEAEYTRYVTHLDLKNVFFRGHADEMKEQIIEEQFDLIWFQGYLNRPAGYAGFDVALTGVPQLFWDFYPGVNPNINVIDYTYPHFKSIRKLAEASLQVLQNKELAHEISQRQFNNTIETRDMQKNIEVIADLLPGLKSSTP